MLGQHGPPALAPDLRSISADGPQRRLPGQLCPFPLRKARRNASVHDEQIKFAVGYGRNIRFCAVILASFAPTAFPASFRSLIALIARRSVHGDPGHFRSAKLQRLLQKQIA